MPFVVSTIDLFEFAGEFQKKRGRYLLLDEIHKYKNFSIHLKAIYDVYPHLKVLFTGSCATSILNAQADLTQLQHQKINKALFQGMYNFQINLYQFFCTTSSIQYKLD